MFNSKFKSADNIFTSTCNSIVTSASINIAYANAGDTANPQPMILYVGYEWGSPQTIAYQVNLKFNFKY